MTSLVLPPSGTLNISHIPDINAQLREQLQQGVSPEKIGYALLTAIGIGDRFTGKALRLLSGRLPVGIMGRDIMSEHLQELMESKKRNPEPIILWNLLCKTSFIWKDMQALMQNWTPEALVGLNNLIYNMTIDGANLGDGSMRYIQILDLISSQFKHKEGIKIESGDPKKIYGSITTSPDGKETPRERKVYRLHITKKGTPQ